MIDGGAGGKDFEGQAQGKSILQLPQVIEHLNKYAQSRL